MSSTQKIGAALVAIAMVGFAALLVGSLVLGARGPELLGSAAGLAISGLAGARIFLNVRART